jgi:hypothetical protein
MDTFKSIVDKVEDTVGDVVKKAQKTYNDAISKSTGFAVDQVEKSLKRVGVYNDLDKLYKKYGQPTFKFGANLSDKVKKDFKSKLGKVGINVDDVIILMRAYPPLNKVIKKLDNMDGILHGMADGDMKKVARIGADMAVNHYIGKLMPPDKRVQFALWAYKYDVANRMSFYIDQLQDDFQRKGREISKQQAREMLINSLKKSGITIN